MPGYSTISGGISGRGTPDSMTRNRRARAGQQGGGVATMFSSVVNILNTILGAGILAMPFILSQMGIMLGVLVIVWSAMASGFGLYLQSRCARYLDRGTSSFFAIAQLTYPNASVVFDSAIAIKCFGVGVSYLIIVGDLMPGVMMGFNPAGWETMPWMVSRNFWITAFMVPVVMLSFLKKLDSLKYTSIVALLSIVYLVILVIYYFAEEPLQDKSQLRLISWAGPVQALASFPVVVFAYTCHQNMFSVLNEIKDNSPSSIMGVIGTSVGSACSLYIVVAIAGYMTFGNDVVGNLVSLYPNGTASTIGKAAIVILEMFSIPLQVHPCRASLDAILKWASARLHSDSSRSPSPGGRSAPARGDHVSAPMSEIRFAILTGLILVLSYSVALTVSSLDRMLAFVGSTGSTSISFILPGLFYYKISDPDSIHHQSLLKEDDDADNSASDVEDSASANLLAGSTGSVRSAGSAAGAGRSPWSWRRKWRWDLESIEHGLLRKMALGLAIYGLVVMAVCLIMNTVHGAASH